MSIDALLYRPITENSQFEGLIPPYQGQEISLDKESDNSTTYDTLKYMDQWATKYAYQMKAVAPRLKGRDLKETAAKIYAFLYSHFQYKLDGSLQNLYSPSAAWKFRKQGFDCKTYSILASTILRNLNIPHTFRMVQQLGIMPGEWSHVYVIVPDNNTHYVIDATTHSNKEVIFTKKHDYTMIHRGLASPYPYGALGCACQGKAIKKNVGLGAPAVLSNTIANFHTFLNELEKKGFPREVTDKMLFLVKSNIENGIDPNFDEIVAKAILPTSKLGEIVPFTSYLTPNASTYTSMPATSYGSTPSYSPATSGSFLTSGFATGATTALSNVSVGGINAGGAITAITGLLTGNPLAAIGLITSLIPMEKTFGAVFANGFDLSCWGSTVTPSMTKAWGEKDFPGIMNETLGRGVNQQNLNAFLDEMNHAESFARYWGAKMRSCSQKGLYNYADAAKKAKEGILDGVKAALAQQNIQMIALPITANSTAKTPFKYSSVYWNNEYPAYKVERFNIIVPPQQQQQQTAPVQYQTVKNPDGTISTVPVPTEEVAVKSSSSTPLLLGGAALLAIKLLI